MMQIGAQTPPPPLAGGGWGEGANRKTQHSSAPLDPSPLPPPARGGGGESPPFLKSAHDFEALTIGQLLAPMFATVDTAHGLFGGGQAEEAWRPMLAEAIGKQVAAHGGLGFAGPVYDALLRAQEQQPGAKP